MAKGKNKGEVSVWFWMFALFVIALPCIGLVMTFFWAFTGENQTRKNYFRALLVWYLIIILIWVGGMALGFWPEIQKQLSTWFRSIGSR